MARTYRTLSLSLPPGVAEELAVIGKTTTRTAARVAAEIVLHAIAKIPASKHETRQASWCCQAPVVAVEGQLVVPENPAGVRRWIPMTALLCGHCGKQLHGREYEGWL